MPNIQVNGIQIEYETFGDRSLPALVLIGGLSSQMTTFDEEFCNGFADRGYFVVRFDNRDTGLSSKIDEAGVPDMNKVFEQYLTHQPVEAAYSLDDMADDTAGLIEGLSIGKAHICGISMGSAIAQTLAVRHPDKVRSLTLVYGTTGNPELPQSKPEALNALITPAPEGREANIEHQVSAYRIFAGSGFPFEEEWIRELMASRYDRCYHPAGVLRQLIATLAHGNRKPALQSITVPTLVVHGSDDPLVPVEGGKDTAEGIPGAELMTIEGMGHDLPHGSAWPQIIEKMAAHLKSAG